MQTPAPLQQNSPRRTALRWLGHWCVLNAVVVALFFIRYALTVPEIDGPLAWVFLLTGVAGHALALSMLAALPVAALALFAPARKALAVVGVVLYSLFFVLLAVDSSVYRLYRFHLNGMVWELLTGGAATEILPMETSFLLVTALVPLFAVGVAVATSKAADKLTAKDLSPLKPLALLAACLIFANAVHAYADAGEKLEVASLARVLPGFRPLTAKRFFRKLGWEGKATARTMKAPTRGNLEYPGGDVAPGPKPSGLNVLVIFLDGWRRDDFTREVTPNIARLAESGLTFSDHWSTGNATRFGVFGFFYGIHATYWHDLLAAQRPPVLLEAARSLNYRFGIFASAPLTSPEFDRTVFVSVRDKIPLSTPGSDVIARDYEITRRFEEFVDKGGDNPFFSFLFYDSTHLYAFPKDYPAPFAPYRESINHLALDNSTDPAPVHNRLKNSYHFADTLVTRVVGKLREKGLLEKTVVIITGDHGEEMNDTRNNFWGHNSAFTKAQSAVPLIVLWPGKGAGRYEQRTSHADVAPTLMKEVFDSSARPETFSNGRSLFDRSERPFVIVSNWDSFALVERDATYVSLPTGGFEAFDGNYRAARGNAPKKETMLAALKELGGFYRKGSR